MTDGRVLLRLTVIASIFAALILVPVPPCWACECSGDTDPAVLLQAADAALIGTVQKVEDLPWNLLRGWNGGDELRFHVRVEDEIKGAFDEVVVIHSMRNPCIADLKPGQRYGLLLSRENLEGANKWSTDKCLVNTPQQLQSQSRVPGPEVGDGQTLRSELEKFRVAEAVLLLNFELWFLAALRRWRGSLNKWGLLRDQ